MKILKVEPHEHPEVVEVEEMTLEWLQEQVGGLIECVYPFDDPVGVICDEEGKLKGKPFNRGILDENGELNDILVGTFLVVGLGDEDFCGLSDELLEKYKDYYESPEYLIIDHGNIMYLKGDLDASM